VPGLPEVPFASDTSLVKSELVRRSERGASLVWAAVMLLFALIVAAAALLVARPDRSGLIQSIRSATTQTAPASDSEVSQPTPPAAKEPDVAPPAPRNARAANVTRRATRVEGDAPPAAVTAIPSERTFEATTPGLLPPTEWALPVEPTEERVYGPPDEDVTAPELVRSQRFEALTTALQAGESVTIEFVVSEKGTVGYARASHPPRTVGESLFLAAGLHSVKSWQYRPAVKNGIPVPYRIVLKFETAAR
jgi:hypothetical protein